VNVERDHALTTGSILWVIIPLCDRCHLLGNLQTVELPMRIALHRFTSVAGAIEAAAKIIVGARAEGERGARGQRICVRTARYNRCSAD
jgi:hypothetical protein